MKVNENIVNENIVISLKHVDLEYTTPVYRSHTFKEYVFNWFSGKTGYSTVHAVKDVSFDILKGESVAFLGHNGSGKSSLLRMIAGIFPVNKNGRVDVKGRIAPMIEITAGFDIELSGYENIYLSCTLMGLSTIEIDERIDEMIEFSELKEFIHMPFKNYSSGMQARLGFACATSVDPDVLLVDEVLSVGDANFEKKCLKRVSKLREGGTTIILVSHSEDVVKSFCSRGIVLFKGEMKCDAPIDEAVNVHREWMDKV